jgi:YgiT-type zinc finger domain-containing protein
MIMKTDEQLTCSVCASGHYAEAFVPYQTTTSDGLEVTIPQVRVLRCSQCGDELLPPDAQKHIDEALAEATEQLTCRELERMAERFGDDQTEIAETMGLGSKTFHRWLKGTQYPSRSMGYYMRVLVEFPEAFEWLKARGWRQHNRLRISNLPSFEQQFPDLAKGNAKPQLNSRPCGELRFNPPTLFRNIRIS